jgi:hypothetical protein
VAVVVSNRQLWLLGKSTIECWYDSGDADFPFSRVSGAVTDIGVKNAFASASIPSSIFFAGDDNKVYATSGYTSSPVSTPSIEKAIKESDSESIRMFSFSSDGEWKVVVKTNKFTFVYNVSSAQWHRRMSCDSNGWDINATINTNSTDYGIIGWTDNKIVKLSTSITSEDGRVIERSATTVPVNNGVNYIRVYGVQLDMDNVDKKIKVDLQFSKDDGRSWSNSNFQYTGDVGDHKQMVRWHRLGAFRDCIMRITIKEDADIFILGLYANIKENKN